MGSTNSLLSEQQVARACAAIRRRKDADVLRVLFVGRLSALSSAEVLLHAMVSLKLPLRRVECAIVGGGPGRQDLEAQAIRLGLSNRVTFTGDLNPDQVPDYYEQANVLVLASDAEERSQEIIQAMAFGLVCIGTGPEWLRQILGDGRGLLLPSGDVQALKVALQCLAVNPQESAAMSTRAALWAQKQFSQSPAETQETLLKAWTASVTAPDQLPQRAPEIRA